MNNMFTVDMETAKRIERIRKILAPVLIAALIISGLFVPKMKVKAADTPTFTVTFNKNGYTGEYYSSTFTVSASSINGGSATFSIPAEYLSDIAVLNGRPLKNFTWNTNGWLFNQTDVDEVNIPLGEEYPFELTLDNNTNEYSGTFNLVFEDEPVVVPFYFGNNASATAISATLQSVNRDFMGEFNITLPSTLAPSNSEITSGVTSFLDTWEWDSETYWMEVSTSDSFADCVVNGRSYTVLLDYDDITNSNFQGIHFTPVYSKISLPVNYSTTIGQVLEGVDQNYASTTIDDDAFIVEATLPYITDMDPGYDYNGWNISFPNGSDAFVTDGNNEGFSGAIPAGTRVLFHIPRSEAESKTAAFSVTAVADEVEVILPKLFINISCEGGNEGGSHQAPDSATPETINDQQYYSYTYTLPDASSGAGFTTAVWSVEQGSRGGRFIMYQGGNLLSPDSLVMSGGTVTIKATAETVSSLIDNNETWAAYGYVIEGNNTYSFPNPGELHYYLHSGEWRIGEDGYDYHTDSLTDITDQLEATDLYTLSFRKIENTR